MVSEFKLGIIKCPKCKKYFITAETVDALSLGKKKGHGKCPYCLNILSNEEYRKNIVKSDPFEEVSKKIERKQGDLRVILPLNSRLKKVDYPNRF